ncbi:MAG: hypothetical protein ABSB49_17740 [Polyangia bacterium]|jgi:hypothetical protein
MSNGNATPIDRVNDIPRILEELRRCVREALARHRRSGNSVPVWRDRQVCWVPAADIPVETDNIPGSSA